MRKACTLELRPRFKIFNSIKTINVNTPISWEGYCKLAKANSLTRINKNLEPKKNAFLAFLYSCPCQFSKMPMLYVIMFVPIMSKLSHILGEMSKFPFTYHRGIMKGIVSRLMTFADVSQN